MNNGNKPIRECDWCGHIADDLIFEQTTNRAFCNENERAEFYKFKDAPMLHVKREEISFDFHRNNSVDRVELHLNEDQLRAERAIEREYVMGWFEQVELPDDEKRLMIKERILFLEKKREAINSKLLEDRAMMAGLNERLDDEE